MNHGLLVVDVQPSYHKWCSSVAESVARRINNTRKPVSIMWVGSDSGLTDDTQEDVYEYLRSNGAYRPALDRATFVEKDYGFFRNWMDNGVPHNDIINVGRHMYSHGLRHSDKVDMATLYEGSPPDFPAFGIHLPNFNESRLLQLDKFDICGGGREECLTEMELWLAMRRKASVRLESLVY